MVAQGKAAYGRHTEALRGGMGLAGESSRELQLEAAVLGAPVEGPLGNLIRLTSIRQMNACSLARLNYGTIGSPDW